MYDIGKHFHLESQGRNPALVFAAIVVIFGAFATLSHRNEAWITEPPGLGFCTPCSLPQLYESYLVPGSSKLSLLCLISLACMAPLYG